MFTLPRLNLLLAALTLFSIIGVTIHTLDQSKLVVHAQGDERKLENTLPKHVPLGIKIKKEKEKEFKDLNNENWARDFELEVTNTGDKPIYEFYLDLILDVKDSTGQNVLSSVDYGRVELGDHRERATADDVPIKPGESVVVKIHPGQLAAWDIIRRTEGRPHPKTIQMKLEGLSFGDGTGLGPGGDPLPRKRSSPLYSINLSSSRIRAPF